MRGWAASGGKSLYTYDLKSIPPFPRGYISGARKAIGRKKNIRESQLLPSPCRSSWLSYYSYLLVFFASVSWANASSHVSFFTRCVSRRKEGKGPLIGGITRHLPLPSWLFSFLPMGWRNKKWNLPRARFRGFARKKWRNESLSQWFFSHLWQFVVDDVSVVIVGDEVLVETQNCFQLDL